MNWLHYLLEANIYLAVFYLLYFVLFTRDTHYKLVRWYLLITCVLAYIIPLVQVSWLRPDFDRQTVTIIPNGGLLEGKITPDQTHLTLNDAIIYAYAAGVIIMVLIFLFKLVQLYKLTRAEGNILHDKYKLIRLEGSNTAFSFFNYLFIGTRVNGAETIVRHELVHITQKHSLDIVFLELMKTISWFNPFVYLLERSLKTVHEYIADEQTAAYENDTLAYSSFLVNNAYGLDGSSLTHSFFNYNLLKKRIIMLNQKRSGKLARLKYLVTLPVCGALLCASTLGFSKNYALINIGAMQQDTIKKIPPPPPPVPPVKDKSLKAKAVKPVIVTLIPPPPPPVPPKNVDAASKISADVKGENPVVSSTPSKELAAAPKASFDVKPDGKIPPPPPPVDPFADFYKYVAKNVRYPAKDRDDLVGGRVIVTFNVVNNKIADIKLVRGVESVMDGEVLRVLKAYNESLPGNVTITHYSLPLAFVVMDSKGNYVSDYKPGNSMVVKSDSGNTFSTGEASKSYLLNEIVITTYNDKK